jgi:peptide/nickel transport system permease protein
MAQATLGVPLIRDRRNPFADFLTRLVKTKPLGTASAVIVLVFFFVGVFANFIAPHGFNDQKIRNEDGTIMRFERLASPSFDHFLGTDSISRDLFSRIVYGARISMLVGVIGSLTSLVVSCLIGLPSGYFGGKFDLVVQRFIDAWLVFPDLILLILLVALVGPSLWNIVFILGLQYGLGGSRSVRGAVIGIRQNAYIEASQAVGVSTPRILMRHVLPNVAPFLLVLVTTRMPGMILAEAGLSFLGLGVPAPAPSWGGMLSSGAMSYMLRAPMLAVWPGLALSIVVYSTNMFGDALRDLLDPRLRGSMGGRY